MYTQGQYLVSHNCLGLPSNVLRYPIDDPFIPWDFLGYPGMSQTLLAITYLDQVEVIARAWDVPGYPKMSQGILGTTWTWDK